MLIALLALALVAGHTADVTVLGIHPGSGLLVGAYLVGLATVRQVQTEPLWIPTRTRETVMDEPEENAAKERSTGFLWMEFVGLGLLVSAAGWAVTEAAQGIVEHTGLDESVVGVVLMGLTNAMPETITSIAAVRRGALTLAVGSVWVAIALTCSISWWGTWPTVAVLSIMRPAWTRRSSRWLPFS